jgi:hypothetical protein
MSQATLETLERCADSAVALSLEDRLVPDRQVLALLRGIPELAPLFGGAVASWHSSFSSLHSRRWHRVAYDKPLLITPVDDSTDRPSEPALLVRGRDLSLSGVSFMHPRPLASRKVIVRFESDDPATSSAILAILRWCRFRRDGFYQSGGQFVRGGGPDEGWDLPDAECEDARTILT